MNAFLDERNYFVYGHPTWRAMTLEANDLLWVSASYRRPENNDFYRHDKSKVYKYTLYAFDN